MWERTWKEPWCAWQNISWSSISIINPINGPSSEELETSKLIPNPDVSIKISPLATASIAGIHIEIIPPCVRWTNWIAVIRIGIQLHSECTLNMCKCIHTERAGTQVYLYPIHHYRYPPEMPINGEPTAGKDSEWNNRVVRIIYFSSVVFKPNRQMNKTQKNDDYIMENCNYHIPKC